jgi:hypothetical protein
MKFKPALNIVFGISTEILYALAIMLASFLICLVLTRL